MSDAADVDVDPARVRELHERGEVHLVDVREDYEHAAGHIAGDRHIALQQLATEAPSLDRERPVVFYCRVGGRSELAARAFRRAGYDAYSMVGGLLAWDGRDLPLEPAGGHVADH